MPADVPAKPPASAPQPLQDLWPWVQEFAYSDDLQREQALEAVGTDRLKRLVDVIDKLTFQLINQYLDDSNNSEEAVPYGDLAQAAMEAAYLMNDKGGQ